MTRSTEDEQLRSIRGFSQNHCRSADEDNRAYIHVGISGLHTVDDVAVSCGNCRNPFER
jgi:hypothetical protein